MGGADQDQYSSWRTEVKRRRELLGLNYRQASTRTRGGMSDQRWRNLENGYEVRRGQRITADPSRGGVLAIARALDWPMPDALAAAGLEPPTEGELTPPSADPLERIQAAWTQITPIQRAAVADVVESMAWPTLPGEPVREEHIHPQAAPERGRTPNGSPSRDA